MTRTGTRIGLATISEYTIGIDISKTHLDVFRLEDQAVRPFESSARGGRALIKWLGRTPVARIVFEPTGPYRLGDRDHGCPGLSTRAG